MDLAGALGDLPLAAALRGSVVAYPLVNAAHIAALGLLIGAIVTLDLRLLGVFARYPAASLAPPLSAVAAAGLTGAVATGGLLFLVRPAEYLANPAFLLKLALVAAGIGNALAIRFSGDWRCVLAGGSVSLGLRLGAALSILIWLGAVVAGRWIGFV